MYTVFENHIKKISFNITSEASHVYIFSGQQFIKNAQKWPILRWDKTKIGGNFRWFSNIVM